MGTSINLLNTLSSTIWAGIGVLVPELFIAFVSFYWVKDERKRIEVFLTGTIMLVVLYLSLLAISYGQTRNLLEHTDADYKDGIIWTALIKNDIEDQTVFNGRIYGLPNGLSVDWGFRSPKKNLPKDHFSVVFSTQETFQAGLYCFVMKVDDGAELFVDGNPLMLHYYGFTPGAIFKMPIQLTSDRHKIDIKYYDDINTANIFVYWYELHGDKCESVNEP